MRTLLRITWITTPALVVVLILLWWAAIGAFGISSLLLPTPGAVWTALTELLGDTETYHHTLITLQEVLVGFGIACAGGIGLGAVVAKVPTLERLLQPFIVATQVAPKTPLIPLLIVWCGFGPTSKIVIAGIFAFFPIFTNTVLGVKSTPEGLHDVAGVLRLSRRERFVRIELPNSLPNVLAGMEIGIVLAIIGAIVGEFLAGSQGLGYLTVAAMNNYQTAQLFGVIIMLTVLGFLLHLSVLLLRRRLLYWHESRQADSAPRSATSA